MDIVESYPGRDQTSLCSEQANVINSLIEALETVQLPKGAKESTTGVLRTQLENVLTCAGWRNDYVIDNNISMTFPTANYTLDFSLDREVINCVDRHRFFIEFCFDNRQAIGTNLLKFEVASKNVSAQGWKPLPILVCAISSAIKEFGWDGGVGSYQEYDHAIRNPYKSLLKNPPVLIAIK